MNSRLDRVLEFQSLNLTMFRWNLKMNAECNDQVRGEVILEVTGSPPSHNCEEKHASPVFDVLGSALFSSRLSAQLQVTAGFLKSFIAEMAESNTPLKGLSPPRQGPFLSSFLVSVHNRCYL